MSRRVWMRWRRPALDIAAIAALLVAVSYLPPDTSLRDRQAVGTLRYCVADVQNPLVTLADGKPGSEHQLMLRAAQALDLRLVVVGVSSMGRAFNPADWNVTRGQCDVLGGGLADSALNRGFLEMMPTGENMSLVMIGAEPGNLAAGAQVGVYAGTVGFDRLQLSAWMRGAGWRATPLRDEAAANAWLAQGNPMIVPSVTQGWVNLTRHVLPPEAAQNSRIAIGFWRGDMTLIRGISPIFE